MYLLSETTITLTISEKDHVYRFGAGLASYNWNYNSFTA